MTTEPATPTDGPTGPDEHAGTPLLDEDVAVRTASLVASRRRTSPDEVAALRAEVDADLPRIDAAARAWTELGADLPPTTATVVGRSGWVRANLTAIRGTFEPLRERLEKRPGAARIMGAQVGVLFGLLSTKVLGQYILPLGGPGGGQLVIVGPNVLDLADKHGPLATDVRRAILLHEVTHRLQFDGNPWLEGHLRGLVDRYLEHAEVDASTLKDAAARLPDMIAEARATGSIQPLLGAVLTPEQQEVIDEAQGLMSLLEGHGNAAMYAAAPSDLIVEPDAVRDAIASRRNDLTTKVLTAVAGLEMKRRQYRDGEAFVRGVIDLAGMAGVNRAFASAANLPSVDEVADPAAWLDRVQAA